MIIYDLFLKFLFSDNLIDQLFIVIYEHVNNLLTKITIDNLYYRNYYLTLFILLLNYFIFNDLH
jgi:hypothetical protein